MDTIEKYVIYPFEKVRRKIPMREKYLNTVVFTIIALIASEIPLINGIRIENNSEVSFKVYGSLMQLGTQPFVFASMVAPLLFDKTDKHHGDILGFLLSIFMALNWAYAESNWIGGIQLMAVSYILLQAEVYLKDRGAISPSTALIFANASRRLLMSLFIYPISFIWTVILILSVAWIETLSVTIPLTHMKYRLQTTSMEIPVMYNSTTALIIYYTIVEIVANIYQPVQVLLPNELQWTFFVAAPALYLGVYLINNNMAAFNEQTGKDLVQNWKKQKYTIKGWRDPKRMYRYVQKIIDRNVNWNTIFICLLWSLGIIYRPSVGITTLFILISTIKRHRPSWSLLEQLR